MARRFVVSSRIEAEDRASGNIRRAETSFDKLRRGITRLSPAFLGFSASIGAATAALVRGVRDALEYERQIRRLERAFSDLEGANVTGALRDQADALSIVTGATDTAILSTQALIAGFGATPEQTQKLTAAAVEAAAALGVSLDQAAGQVAKTLGGYAGELGELIPELRNLTKEQLQAGEAADVLLERFGGTAEATRTAETGFRNLSNAISDYIRSTVSGVSQSEGLTEALDDLAASIRANQEAIPGFLRGLEQLREDARGTAPVLGTLTDALVVFAERRDPIVAAWLSIANAVTSYGNAVRETERLEESVAAGRERIANQREDELARETQAVTRARDAQVFWNQALEEANRLLEAQALEDFADEARKLGFTLERELRQELEDVTRLQIEFGDALRAGTITERDYAQALEALARKEDDLRAKLGERREALERTTRSTREQVVANEALQRSEETLLGRVQLVNDELGRRVDIVNAEGQRTGSRLTSSPGDPLFPGLSGNTYTYTVRRSTPTPSGGVRFV